jgi:crotonobetainyl-CoA:carnitine CoA-transferase CaiB-like acyl-CoA transferase
MTPTTQTIDIQYSDGRPDEHLEGDDLSAKWDEVTEGPGILYAAWRKPKRNGDGSKLAGVFGATRDERAESQAARQAEREELDRAAAERMIAKRTWEWTAPNMSSHL